MDWVTLAVGAGLIGFGALIVYWPMGLRVTILQNELDQLVEDYKALHEANQILHKQLDVEEEIDRARDLDPDDELDVLLHHGPVDPPSAPAGGRVAGRYPKQEGLES